MDGEGHGWLAWAAFGTYLVLTTLLALRGMQKTKSFAGFALGNRDMGPVLVGITLAAAIASSATFVINPGFVYAFGLSALLHYGVASALGVTVGLVVLSRGFRRLGNESGALTLPHWIGARYGHSGMRTYFAILNLVLAVSFVVLLIKGSAIVMEHTLGTSYLTGVVITVAFVFSYIMMGGTYAHAYTNAFQGGLMILVALVIIGSGVHLLGGGLGPFVSDLASIDPALVTPVRESGPLFTSSFEIWFSGFVVAFGLTCQPHILTKALYLKNDSDLTRYLVVATVIGLLFAAMLVAGLWARMTLEAPVAQDAAMALYIKSAFPPAAGVLISVALLAAGMSTMDGILVSASTIAGNDLFLGALGARFTRGKSEDERQRLALSASRIILVVMGISALVIALDPPLLVGLFAQMGVYGLVAASLVPVAGGIFFTRLDAQHVFAAAIAGPLVHFAHYGYVTVVEGQIINPAIPATEGIAASCIVIGALTVVSRVRRRRANTRAASVTASPR
jgi:SSS family solute:Na+ symporter/sodium/pantothenate symporter